MEPDPQFVTEVRDTIRILATQALDLTAQVHSLNSTVRSSADLPQVALCNEIEKDLDVLSHSLVNLVRQLSPE
jgi:hypothetical protein